MPASRGRRQRNRPDAVRRRERSRRYHATRRFAAAATVDDLTALMSSADWTNLRASADAEARGDAREALRLYGSINHFEGSWHGARLALMAELADDAPAWLVTRWLTLQARRPLWSGADASAGHDDLAGRTLEIAYPHGVEPGRMQGLSPDVFLSLLHERDWVMRQLIVYEDDGLRGLVRARASQALLARADDPEAWADARMGGYRLESDRGGFVQVADPGTGEVIDLLDLGLAFQHWPGRHLLGRVVPTSTPPGRMFEWRPLPVDAETAALVASDPGRWIEIVAERARSQELACGFSLLDDDTDMLTDLPANPWLALIEPEQIDNLPSAEGLVSYDDVGLAVLERLLSAFGRTGSVPAVARPVVWSLLLQPGMDGAVRERFAGVEHALGWRAIADAVPEPAKSRCMGYAQRARAATG